MPPAALDVFGAIMSDPDAVLVSTQTLVVSGDLKIESDGDPDWHDVNSHLGSDDESAHDSIAPTVVDTADAPLADNPGEASFPAGVSALPLWPLAVPPSPRIFCISLMVRLLTKSFPAVSFPWPAPSLWTLNPGLLFCTGIFRPRSC